MHAPVVVCESLCIVTATRLARPAAMKPLVVCGSRPMTGSPSGVSGRRQPVCLTIFGPLARRGSRGHSGYCHYWFALTVHSGMRECRGIKAIPLLSSPSVVEISASRVQMCAAPSAVGAASKPASASSVVPTHTSRLAWGAT